MDKEKVKKIPERSEIPDKYKWNIEAMYPEGRTPEADLQELLRLAEDFPRFSGHLGDSSDTLLEAFKENDKLGLLAEHLIVYAHQKRDEDNRNTEAQVLMDKAMTAIARASASLSFFSPELIEVPEEKLRALIDENAGLKPYRFLIENELRGKDHILTSAEERIMANFGEITSACDEAASMMNDADMKFGEIADEDGKACELTHGNYIRFMESPKREVRKEAFEHMYAPYMAYINTLATLYNYNVKTEGVLARLRKYPSVLEGKLYGDKIPVSVYDNLIDVVHESLPLLHRYLAIKKKALGVDELHMYDVYVPLVEAPEVKVTYEEALEIMYEALAPLGETYINDVKKGVSEGWIDVMENVGKTSGAYSFGSYDSYPYMLLNFREDIKYVSTIVHEMGHCMHSYYSRAAQPFIYAGHSIFTAETASTVNETLLAKYLIARESEKLSLSGGKDEKARLMKLHLLNDYLEGFRATIFRQTMFAEFEKQAHGAAESGEVLTADHLCGIYGKLNELYFGKDVVSDEQIRYEWARIPHFYNAFYVYQYATGYSAANALVDRILNEGGRDDYLEFLKTGSSDYPIELLKKAGVDMSSPEPIKKAMQVFASLLDEFEALLEN